MLVELLRGVGGTACREKGKAMPLGSSTSTYRRDTSETLIFMMPERNSTGRCAKKVNVTKIGSMCGKKGKCNERYGYFAEKFNARI